MKSQAQPYKRKQDNHTLDVERPRESDPVGTPATWVTSQHAVLRNREEERWLQTPTSMSEEELGLRSARAAIRMRKMICTADESLRGGAGVLRGKGRADERYQTKYILVHYLIYLRKNTHWSLRLP